MILNILPTFNLNQKFIGHSFVETGLLALILLLGGILRFWHITSGLPDLYVHDEIFEVHRALELLRGEYNFYRMKGLYFYFLSFMASVYAFVLIAMGYFSDLAQFVSHYLVHPGDIVLLSRMLTASLGTVSIYLLYCLGKMLFPEDPVRPSLLLALAWSTCGLGVWISKWGLIETTLVTFGILSFFPIINILHKGRRRDYILAAVSIAAAAATKIYGVLLFLPLLVAHYNFHASGWSLKNVCTISLEKKLLESVVIFAFSLCIINPAIPIYFLKSGLSQGIFPPVATDRPPVFPFWTYFSVLRWNVGNFALPLFGIGALMAVRRGQKAILVCGCFCTVFFLLLGLREESFWIYPRYLLLSLPLFFVVIIYGVEVTRSAIRGISPNQVFGKVASVGIVVGFAFGITWNGLTMLLDKPVFGNTLEVSVQEQALFWFESHVSQGAKVVLLGGQRPWPGNQTIPIFDTSQNYLQRYKKFLEMGKTREEYGFLVDLAKAKNIYQYDLIMENQYAVWKSLNVYIKMGAEVFVIDLERFQGKNKKSPHSVAKKSRQKLYRDLRSSDEVVRLQVFKGRTFMGVPRTIEVYKVISPKKSLLFDLEVGKVQ